jgi:hypothetical protein
MVIVTLQQIINERISFLRYQINPNNKPEVNSTFQLQIDVIRSVDDIENVEPPSNVVHYVQIVGRFYDSSGLLIDTDFTLQ